MFLLGTQYYRPPFPKQKYWDADLADMAKSGLNTVQLWVKWGWVEPEPDKFTFDDYDRLVDLAEKHGLKVVLSTIAAIHPYWIHRVVPGSEMVDNMGNRVISSNRVECHNGLTPGGCFDHPGVWDRMSRFLAAVTERYRGAANLAGWDCWNEVRWNVNADGLVCYCDHTVARFRKWLDEKHSGLAGLNEAWQRRYCSWDDVLPGKMPQRTYTEMMAFEHFITWRTNQHAADRYCLMKRLDPNHPITIHGAYPSVLGRDGYPGGTALHRGSDWAFSDVLDGVGTSSFPHWGGMDDFAYATRITYTASAAQGKRIWLSEVQGGRAAYGFQVHTPVAPPFQQRWVWVGISRGVEAVLFWCWRDEVFGRESGGFGLSGADGHAEQRLAAMRKTGGIIKRNESLLAGYQPDAAEVGVWFSPQTYYLQWAEEKTAGGAHDAIEGYSRALLRRHIPFRIVEEDHLDGLAGLKLLFLPRTLVIDQRQADKLAEFVRSGGTLVCESECGAFAPNGLYRYPQDRFLSELTGVAEIGRRSLRETIACRFDDEDVELPAMQWLTPLAARPDSQVLADSEFGPIIIAQPVGAGRVVFCGTYLGQGYCAKANNKGATTDPLAMGMERFVAWMAATAGVASLGETIPAGADHAAWTHLAAGQSGERRLLFVFSDGGKPVRLRVRRDVVRDNARDLISDAPVKVVSDGDAAIIDLPAGEWGISVMVS